MSEADGGKRRLYKARGADGEVAWVDHDELWRLQQRQQDEVRRAAARRRRRLLLALAGLVAVTLVLAVLRLRAGRQPSAAALSPPPPPPASTAPEAATGAVANAPAGATMDEAAGAVGGSAQGAGQSGPGAAAGRDLPEAAAAEPERTASAPASAAAPLPPAAERAAAAVRAWADAWARRDVGAYLASYSERFAPADGVERPAWEEWRRSRLRAPPWIRVEIEGLEIELRGGGRALARFVQTYDSPIYSDVVRKSLELVEEDGGWRITAERSEVR